MGRPNISRERIIEAAAEVFAATGYHRATMEDIAARAEVAKGTLYYNFSTKAQLFEAVLEAGMEYLRGPMQQELERDDAPRDRMDRVIRHHVEVWLEYPELAQLFLGDPPAGLEPHTAHRIHSLREEYLRFLGGMIEEAQRHSIIRPISAELGAVGLLSLVNAVCRRRMDHPDRITTEQVLAFLRSLLVDGLVQHG